ncbi:MAG: phospho-sugar mutase [Ilumatobacteraceae bacterium]|nr:phospho-sugar mutase [Ilumatobacteraceae bacterium]
MSQHRAVAERWLRAEPDDDVRRELRSLLDAGDHELDERFSVGLTFGTAGLRAAIGAGPSRMNRLVVRRAAAGLVDHLLTTVPGAAERGLLIACDARHKSAEFALDTARVAAARGMKAHLIEGVTPTPVLAWNTPRLGVAAAVMVTASHNPREDNGYKVYLGHGAQIVPPDDEAIAARIDAVDAPTVPLADADDRLIRRVGDEATREYLDWLPSVRRRPDVRGARLGYTAMHGVGGSVLLRAFDACGLPAPVVVDAQQRPDPDFPTVVFPNPEEPGAMDMVIELGRREGLDVVIANDPDADRLGVAVPSGGVGEWRLLRGDEIGWLFADHILRHTTGSDRLVETTVVSSSLLGEMAAAHGVEYRETFTGFKWIADAAMKADGLRLVFAYEQALGYLVADRPLDKDGLTAAVLLAEIAGLAAEEGTTIEGRLHSIAARFGRHVTAERSIKMDPSSGAKLVRALMATPPRAIGGRNVVAVRDYPEANLVRLWLDEEGGRGVRLQIRPSGTEPKVKLYGEGVELPAIELERLLQELADVAVSLV